MTDINKQLQDAKSLEERAEILRNELSDKAESIERNNGGVILDLKSYEGLQIGDKVEYTNALGEKATGYVSHFFKKLRDTQGSKLVETLASIANQNEVEKTPTNHTIPVILSEGGYGYSTHNGYGLPKKIE